MAGLNTNTKIGIITSYKDKEALELISGIVAEIKLRRMPKTKITYVFCDRPENINSSLGNLLRKNSIDLLAESSSELRSVIKAKKSKECIDKIRLKFDKRVFQIIKKYNADFIVLIGYILIMTPYLTKKSIILNLHPDIPGRYKGSLGHVISQIIRNKDKSVGAMIHIVTTKLDQGPPLTFFRVGIKNAKAKRIRKKEYARELPLTVFTLKKIVENKIRLKEYIQRNKLKKPAAIDLSQEIEEYIKKNT